MLTFRGFENDVKLFFQFGFFFILNRKTCLGIGRNIGKHGLCQSRSPFFFNFKLLNKKRFFLFFGLINMGDKVFLLSFRLYMDGIDLFWSIEHFFIHILF